MQNAEIAAEAAVETVADVIGAYLKEKQNPYAEKVCKTAVSIAYHFKATQELWGSMHVLEFKKGAKARVKAQSEQWRRDGLSPSTCRKRASQLKTAFKYCVDEELMPAEWMPQFKLPANGQPRERYIDPVTELPAILRACYHPDTPLHIRYCFLISLHTAQRQGAIRDLTWDLVDFENRVIRFRDTEPPEQRSKKRRTDMPMDNALFEIMTEAKENADTNFVLEWRGKQVRNCYHGIIALYKRAGVTGLHRHDIRRTAATLAYRASGDMRQAANLIGDTVEMAQKHYAQTTAHDRIGSIEAISSAIQKARSVPRAANDNAAERARQLWEVCAWAW